ncbi:MAG: hypothetical protein P4L22_02250 [Candidatus Babeliales bacterium]|nr:hypothetical protein [Candidatus Babeliales bacterium]
MVNTFKLTRYNFIIFIMLTTNVISLTSSEKAFNDGMYFVTASDTEHFPWLQGLILSIQKYNHGKISRISVYDLGLKKSEIKILENIPFVEVCDIETINPDMKTKFIVRPNGRLARGWYTWKPTILYQASKKFPYFLYLDSGFEVVSSLDKIFNEIKTQGYYFYDCGHLILPMVTKRVKNIFKLDLPENEWILEEDGISAGIQGISSKLSDSYILPVYKLATDIKNFEDDGSAFWGFGGARHDQAIFSILVRKLGLKTHKTFCNPNKLRAGNTKIYFGILKYFKFRKHKEKDVTRLIHAKNHKLLG